MYVLDLILSNSKRLQVKDTEPFFTIDKYHLPLLIDFHFHLINEEQQPHYVDFINYKQANYNKINNQLLSVEWVSLNSTFINVNTKSFYNMLNLIIDTHIPKTNIFKSNFPKW